ncbi:UNVERIFIED_CONTAM: hypothetical protein GTU68_035383 [Idotea baltica]|nr:hypothetical protein [Idotea baltica]
MIQGCTSDAGKSVMVAGLCRLLARQGLSVAPFKPQNMALNSAVTIDGGEIGRAQAVQAQACFLEPHTDMNPILLKPSSDTGAQVIVHGHAIDSMQAKQYHDYKKVAMQAVLDSHARLTQHHQTIIVEGAGSPAEINLRTNDIANMGFAEAVDCPVILVADIDRGGAEKSEKLNVVVPVVARISNHTDFDALRLHPNVNLQFISVDQSCPPADLIILPGSKNVISDLNHLKKAGWQYALDKHLRYGGKIIGVCGGYQMLGKIIADIDSVESALPDAQGFGFLEANTILKPSKQLKLVEGKFVANKLNKVTVKGYEIHCGVTTFKQNKQKPVIKLNNNSNDGSINDDNNVLGTYLHGIFDQPEACNSLLQWAGLSVTNAINLDSIREQQLERLADCLEENLDSEFLADLSLPNRITRRSA